MNKNSIDDQIVYGCDQEDSLKTSRYNIALRSHISEEFKCDKSTDSNHDNHTEEIKCDISTQSNHLSNSVIDNDVSNDEQYLTPLKEPNKIEDDKSIDNDHDNISEEFKCDKSMDSNHDNNTEEIKDDISTQSNHVSNSVIDNDERNDEKYLTPLEEPNRIEDDKSIDNVHDNNSEEFECDKSTDNSHGNNSEEFKCDKSTNSNHGNNSEEFKWDKSTNSNHGNKSEEFECDKSRDNSHGNNSEEVECDKSTNSNHVSNFDFDNDESNDEEYLTPQEPNRINVVPSDHVVFHDVVRNLQEDANDTQVINDILSDNAYLE